MGQEIAKAFVLIAALFALGRALPIDRSPLPSPSGTGLFLMLSDLHFDPYSDPDILRRLGATPLPACQAPASGEFSKFGADTNYALLKSTLHEVTAIARRQHFHYDYVIVTGDFLAHGFDTFYHQCVGGDQAAYTKFAADTIHFVDSMIASAAPGAPIFSALGNNDSDHGDYEEPGTEFLRELEPDWSRGWGQLPGATRAAAIRSLEASGNYALPHPTVPGDEIVALNTDLWSARHPQACGDSDPDPGGQLQWMAGVLRDARRTRRTATLIMHIVPGIDGMRSASGAPVPFWTDACTGKFINQLTAFRGVVGEIFAGHIHRDDFRLLPDADGKPLASIHIVPAVSPIYLDNPAVQIAWYGKTGGAMSDYATFVLRSGGTDPGWQLEYTFTQAYGFPRLSLEALQGLAGQVRNGNSRSGAGKSFAEFYGAGMNIFLGASNWRNYSCAQTEITVSDFARCRGQE